MTRMDRGVFAAYCAAYAEFVFFELQLETAEAVAVSENGFAYSNPMYKLRDAAFNRMMATGGKLGFGPEQPQPSRCHSPWCW